jgi:preprotein translocase subunit SecE
MAKEKSKELISRVPMLSLRLYKRTQGRMVRQTTMVSMIIIVLLIAWRARVTLVVSTDIDGWNIGIPLGVMVLGLWFSFRIVHLPRFADFLIAVEAEMNKVSWPSTTELIKSSLVVIIVIFLLTGILFGYDLLWRAVLGLFEIRRF